MYFQLILMFSIVKAIIRSVILMRNKCLWSSSPKLRSAEAKLSIKNRRISSYNLVSGNDIIFNAEQMIKPILSLNQNSAISESLYNETFQN